jgi:hypothetical protein
MRWALCASVVVGLAGSAGAARRTAETRADQGGTIALLDRYERGERDAVVDELTVARDVAGITKDLEKLGPAWTRERGPNQVHRRQIVAATFALETAVPHFWPEEVDPLIEWGCQLLRQGGPPDATERLWERASVAIFGRARDDGRLVTRAGPGAALGSRLPPARRPVDHIAHALLRFPDEPRFRLAQAMRFAVSADTEPPRDAEWVATDKLSKNSEAAILRGRATQAIQMFQPLVDVPTLRAEAELRIGYLWLVLHEPGIALGHFDRARDPEDAFVAYLAWFLGGRASDALSRRDEADAMYRSALQVIPHAQSAADALAANPFSRASPTRRTPSPRTRCPRECARTIPGSSSGTATAALFRP